MFLTSELPADLPSLGVLKLRVAKDQALRKTQELFLEGRQINALYICTHDELKTAEKRKLSWLTQAADLLGSICEGTTAADFFDEVTINVLKESDPIESLSELFHNELNQRLERLRIIRKGIEDAKEPPGLSRPPAPTPKPVQVTPVSSAPAIPSPTDQAGVSSGSTDAMTAPATPRPQVLSVAKPAAAPASLAATKVLLVLCSRNGTARQALCRFSNQMNLSFEIVDYNPEQPHSLIEQIYRHRDAKFAIVYWGEPTGRELPGSAHPERYVGYALGFILGRLGRARVFILGSTTTPPLPGFTRILMAQLDSGGGWQIPLARRMKVAGLNIDLNKLT